MTVVAGADRTRPRRRGRRRRACSSSSIPDGWWVGELESNATMIAEHLFWLHFLGLRDPETDRKLANELLARRRDDGTWSNWFEGPPDLSTTIEAYVALKLAGVDPGAADARVHPARGRHPEARASSRSASWPCSASGRGSGSRPCRSRSSCCRRRRRSRSTTSPAGRARPSSPLVGRDGAAARCGRRASTCARSAPGPARRGPPRAARAAAAPRARARRRRGCASARRPTARWGGIQPPWVWSIVMLAALGHGFEDETFRRGGRGLARAS